MMTIFLFSPTQRILNYKVPLTTLVVVLALHYSDCVKRRCLSKCLYQVRVCMQIGTRSQSFHYRYQCTYFQTSVGSLIQQTNQVLFSQYLTQSINFFISSYIHLAKFQLFRPIYKTIVAIVSHNVGSSGCKRFKFILNSQI